jgi:hypothetical protein
MNEQGGPGGPTIERGAPPQPQANGMAIASLVLGIAGFVAMPVIGPILALVFGYVGKGQIDRSAGRESGRGFAVAGIVLGWVGIGLALAAAIVGIAFFSRSSPMMGH